MIRDSPNCNFISTDKPMLALKYGRWKITPKWSGYLKGNK